MTLIRDLLKPKIQMKKGRIMKNVNQLYEKYYNVYKNDSDTDDELNEAKKRKCDNKQFKLGDKKGEESKLTALPKWLSTKNHFNKAIKLTEDIRADTK